MEEIAAVYARALFEVGRDCNKLDVVREQLGQFVDALDQSRDMQMFFFSPYFSTDEKKQALAKTVSGADPVFTNFLHLLLEKYRMPAIFRIRRQYEHLWEEFNRVLPVKVTSAVELDPELVKQVGDRIATQTGRKVDLTAQVAPDIVGGIVVRVGNFIIDASIRNRLEQLRKEVARAT